MPHTNDIDDTANDDFGAEKEVAALGGGSLVGRPHAAGQGVGMHTHARTHTHSQHRVSTGTFMHGWNSGSSDASGSRDASAFSASWRHTHKPTKAAAGPRHVHDAWLVAGLHMPCPRLCVASSSFVEQPRPP